MAEILIVDDDHHLRQGFQRLLDAEGYETRTAASAEEALNLMREKMPQCVVMDVRMPGMDGLEALKRMRALEGCPPVVIMTAYSTTETAIEATRLGAFDYMLKPFDIPQVLELLQRALAAGESQRRHEAQSAEEALGEEDDIRLVGHTPPMQELYKAIGRVAPTDALVLRSRSSTAWPSPTPCWRANFSVMNAVPSPARSTAASAVSNRPRAAPSSWTRSATCRRASRPNCCACCRKNRSSVWAGMTPSTWTCASSPPPTPIWSRPWPTDASARTFTTVWGRSPSRFPRCVNARRTFRCCSASSPPTWPCSTACPP